MSTVSSLRRFGAVLALPIVLGGCALPVPVKIAAWVIDGISYVATEKTITDHGISLAMKKDCALLRGVTEGQVCREDEPEIAVALARLDVQEAEEAGAAVATPLADLSAVAETEDLDRFDTASGSVETAEAAEAEILQPTPAEKKKASGTAPAVSDTPDVTREERRSAAVAKAEGANLFYVIASFSSQANAERLVGRYSLLNPSVMPVRIKTRQVYRVLVGPYRKDEMQDAKRRVGKLGIQHVWGIRLAPADWQAARLGRKIDDSPAIASLQE